jgi:predicted nucleic acid-binding protein
MAELYYKTCETLGREVADLRETSLRNSALKVVATDERLTRVAGGLKCKCRGRISLADAYVIAVAQRLRGTLVTTDHLIAELNIVETKMLKIS